MTLGVAALFIALVDALVLRLRGEVPGYALAQDGQG